MKFVKVLKAASNKKYVIYENVISEHDRGYWNENGDLTPDINNAEIFTDIELAKKAIEDTINLHKQNGETVEHYYAIRPVVLEDLNAVYSTYLNKTK